jgi:hypothetical protein
MITTDTRVITASCQFISLVGKGSGLKLKINPIIPTVARENKMNTKTAKYLNNTTSCRLTGRLRGYRAAAE